MIAKKSEIRFNAARAKLALELKNLENTVKEKIHEEAIQSRLIEASANDAAQNQAKIIAQTNTIQNLNHEINELQKHLNELSQENEFLNEKMRAMGQKMQHFQDVNKSLIEAVEIDLVAIEQLINSEE